MEAKFQISLARYQHSFARQIPLPNVSAYIYRYCYMLPVRILFALEQTSRFLWDDFYAAQTPTGPPGLHRATGRDRLIHMVLSQTAEITLRLGVALILGSAIGINR